MIGRTIRPGDVEACPKHSLLPGHYHDDGVCRCTRPDSDDLDAWPSIRPSRWTPAQKLHVWNLVHGGAE